MKKAPLQFSIPKPCNESFADMPQSGEGRLCGTCETVIYDFSKMTDAELLRFFEAKPETHCGRFHHSQLNRVIEPVVVRNSFLRKFAKIAASIIAILTLRSAPAKAQGEMRPLLAQNPIKDKKPELPMQEVFVIKGTVNDETGKPLENVIVKIGDKVVSTDANGQFEYVSKLSGPSNIYFDLPDYVRTVRNFHPAMGDAVFDVVLEKRDPSKFHSQIIQGGIGGSTEQLGNLPSLTFKSKTYNLTKDMKAMLATVAAKMKSTPNTLVTLNAYCPVCTKYSFWEKRLEIAKNYLIEQQGISADRIATNLEVDGGDYNTIDIVSN